MEAQILLQLMAMYLHKSGGTLAPGNTFNGSLKVDGNLTLDNGSTTIIEFDPSSLI